MQLSISFFGKEFQNFCIKMYPASEYNRKKLGYNRKVIELDNGGYRDFEIGS